MQGRQLQIMAEIKRKASFVLCTKAESSGSAVKNMQFL